MKISRTKFKSGGITVRAAALFLALLFMLPCFCFGAAADEQSLAETARAAAVYCTTADRVLWSKNIDATVYPASTVKIMTAILAIEHFEGRYDENITVTAESIKGAAGNRISLRIGEIVTVNDLLCAVIIGGANDAALVLACEVAGSVGAFVDMMNEKAAALGMKNTFYTNPTGLHDAKMFTTVSDIIKLASYAQNMNRFMDTASIARYVMSATNLSKLRYIANKNYLVSSYVEYKYYYPLANGMNSGSTNEAGQCIVATASKNGLNYIAVVMGADKYTKVVQAAGEITNPDGTISRVDEKTETVVCSYPEAKRLLEYAMKSFSYRKVLAASEMICEIPVSLGSSVDHVTLLPEKTVELYLSNDIDLDAELERSWELYVDSLTAPVKSGDVAGLLTLRCGGEVVASVELVAKNNVERSGFLYIMDNIKNEMKKPALRLLTAAFIIGIILYVIGMAVWRSRKKAEARREFYKNRRP